jgi:hypothetical protein
MRGKKLEGKRKQGLKMVKGNRRRNGREGEGEDGS